MKNGANPFQIGDVLYRIKGVETFKYSSHGTSLHSYEYYVTTYRVCGYTDDAAGLEYVMRTGKPVPEHAVCLELNDKRPFNAVWDEPRRWEELYDLISNLNYEGIEHIFTRLCLFKSMYYDNYAHACKVADALNALEKLKVINFFTSLASLSWDKVKKYEHFLHYKNDVEICKEG